MYRTVQIAAPTDEERAQPWLWRFWRNVPERGKFTIFDRSWYGRVLVERVEGFCTPEEWLRAYSEINDFEEQLVDADIVLVKFWLSIDKKTSSSASRSARIPPSSASRSPTRLAQPRALGRLWPRGG